MLISASILNVDEANIKTYLTRLEEYQIDFLHLDVMDGLFVPNKTFNDNYIYQLHELTTIPFDTHLMIDKPERFVDAYIEAKTDYLTFHVEATHSTMALINYLETHQVKVGISIKPHTPVDDIMAILPFVDLVLVMSVEPGFGGQTFMSEVLSKIKDLKSIKDDNDYHYIIEVDGGINYETAKLVKEAGADVIVVGSYLAKNPHLAQAIKDLKAL